MKNEKKLKKENNKKKHVNEKLRKTKRKNKNKKQKKWKIKKNNEKMKIIKKWGNKIMKSYENENRMLATNLMKI